MGFIENLRDILTRGLDGGYSPQHLSNISDEQKQKWDDDRVKSFVENYRKENSSLKIKPGKLGDAGWNTSLDADPDHYDDIARGDARFPRNRPGVYEFTYYTPDDPNAMDSGGTVHKKGVVYMMGPKEQVGQTGQPRGETYVYEATLDDGTKLSAKEFEEFLAANKGMFINAQPLERGDGTGRFKDKENVLEKYREIAKQYVSNPNIGVDYDKKRVVWDKNKRMWMAK